MIECPICRKFTFCPSANYASHLTEDTRALEFVDLFGNMMESARKQKQPIMDKSVQDNLNDYISKQKESILNLSRSSAGFAEVIKQNR